MFTYQDIILNANLAAPARRRLAPRLSLMCQTGSEVSADKDKEKRPIVHRERAPPPSCLLDLNNPAYLQIKSSDSP